MRVLAASLISLLQRYCREARAASVQMRNVGRAHVRTRSLERMDIGWEGNRGRRFQISRNYSSFLMQICVPPYAFPWHDLSTRSLRKHVERFSLLLKGDCGGLQIALERVCLHSNHAFISLQIAGGESLAFLRLRPAPGGDVRVLAVFSRKLAQIFAITERRVGALCRPGCCVTQPHHAGQGQN